MTKQDADGIQGLIFLVGMYEGVIPLIARGLFDKRPFLSGPAHLGSPSWWIVSIAVTVVAAVALIAVDRTATAPKD